MISFLSKLLFYFLFYYSCPQILYSWSPGLIKLPVISFPCWTAFCLRTSVAVQIFPTGLLTDTYTNRNATPLHQIPHHGWRREWERKRERARERERGREREGGGQTDSAVLYSVYTIILLSVYSGNTRNQCTDEHFVLALFKTPSD